MADRNPQSAFYGPPMDDEKRFEVLDKVYAEGELFWDSADIYMDSEDLIGTPCETSGVAAS